MLFDELEEDVPTLEEVGFATELRFVDSLMLEELPLLPLEILSLLPLEVPLPLSALLENVASKKSALLPLSPQAANKMAMLNVAKNGNLFIFSPFFQR